ncbi:hypothetical protein [Paenibacillus kandeliae]|uniref:hypothetical protein n=1 Tax=Paenibacillus kandeliae TaxID=3231269 RepID=UPI00345A8D95
MNEQHQQWIEDVEALLRQERLSPDDEQSVRHLLETVQALQAENQRLRSALVKANNSKKPKMSTRLKDALYE